jgi:membrane protease YdiL (CAAX protease family)
MKATSTRGLLVRISLTLALAVGSLLLVAATAFAAEAVHTKGGPGPAANTGGSGSWLEIVAVLLVLAGVALAIFYEKSRSHPSEPTRLERPVAAPGSQHPSAA